MREDIAGKALLDYCYGRGKWTVHFAPRRARVRIRVDSTLFALAPGLRRYGGECVVVLRR